MIESNSLAVMEDGSQIAYENPTFFLTEVVESAAGVDIGLKYGVYPTVFAATSPQVGAYFFQTTIAAINAKTGSGATDRIKFRNACDQVFEDYLSGLSDNSGVTFTIT